MRFNHLVYMLILAFCLISCDGNPLGTNSAIDNEFNPGGTPADDSSPDPVVPDPDFVPTDFSNLSVWLDSSDTNSMFQSNTCVGVNAANPGDLVGCWKDKSGANNNVTQAVDKPVVSNSGIYFDGVNDILTQAALTYTTASDMTYFIVTKVDTQSNNGGSCCRPIVSWVSNSAALYPWIALTRSNLAPADNLFFGWTGVPLTPTPTAIGDQFLISVYHDGTNKLWNTYESGTQTVTNQAIPAVYTTTLFNVGGDSSNAARRFAGDIQEVIFYDRILTPVEREKLEGYLACKWEMRDRLPLAHTYYNAVASSTTGCPTTAP